MVKPLAALGVAPLVHSSGDVFFNQMLVTWLLPMIAERAGDPLAFAEQHRRGRGRLRQPRVDRDLRDHRRPPDVRRPARRLGCHGLRDDAAALPAGQGRDDLQRHVAPARSCRPARRPVPFDLHVAPPPLVEGASRRSTDPCVDRASRCRPSRPRAETACTRSSSTRAGPRSTRPSSRACSPTRRSPTSNVGDRGPGRAGVPADVRGRHHAAGLALGAGDHAEIDSQVQALVKGDTDPRVRRDGDPGRRRGASCGGSQLLPLTAAAATVASAWPARCSTTKLYAPQAAKRPRAPAAA